MIAADVLQGVLRTSIPELVGATVVVPDPLDAPTRAFVIGAVNIFGTQLAYETPVELTDINSREDVVKLVEGFSIAFRKAEKQAGPLGKGFDQ